MDYESNRLDHSALCSGQCLCRDCFAHDTGSQYLSDILGQTKSGVVIIIATSQTVLSPRGEEQW